MGFRFRKRIRIAPGLTINISKSGISTSIGAKGATTNISGRGVKSTIGIPGTGLSWSSGYGKKNRTKAQPHDENADIAPYKEGLNVWRLVVFLVISFILVSIFKN